MYTIVTTRRHGDRVYRYLQICENVREPGKKHPRRIVIGSLGNVDHLAPERVDSLILSLKAFASPEMRDRLGHQDVQGVEILDTRRYGGVVALRKLWEELGLPDLIDAGELGFDVERAVFRLVANRLLDPQSKLSTVDWQRTVEWSEPDHFEYQHFLRAMDALIPQKRALEVAVFQRVRDLFSVPLRLVWYDLTSSYFEGNGVCPLAEYGHSRDHRSDRAQIVLGLAVTQEGFPIAHEVFSGSTGDVTTVKEVAEDLKERFGLSELVLVGDRGMLSRANAALLDDLGLRYVMALRTRQHAVVPKAVDEALQLGMQRPRDPNAAWQVREVSPHEGVRHVVVYSAYRAVHDRVVRSARLRRALAEMATVRAAVAQGRLTSEREVAQRVERVLGRHHARKLIRWDLAERDLDYRLDMAALRRQRHLDGIYILVSNDPELTAGMIVDAYRQLRQVEEAFRVLKSLVKLRPIRHWAERRVLSHVLICVLAYLMAKVLEQRLARAGTPMAAETALRHLHEVDAVDYITEGYRITQVAAARGKAAAALRALDLSTSSNVLRTEPIAPTTTPSATATT